MIRRVVPQVTVGDVFVKVGDPHGKIWEVIDLRIASDGILHAALRDSARQSTLMTIAAGVLADGKFWSRSV